MSLVRSLKKEEIDPEPSLRWLGEHLGFLRDEHQMNVGLTRARRGLCIIGEGNHIIDYFLLSNMVGHLFQNYDTIYVRFFFFLPRILAFFPALWVQTRIYMRTKKPIYMRYKQACGIWGHRKSSYKRHRIIPSAKNPFMYDGAEK